jgi:hypothetical protein
VLDLLLAEEQTVQLPQEAYVLYQLVEPWLSKRAWLHAAGVAEAAQGIVVNAYINNNPILGPKYTANNFRENLLKRTPIPRGMNQPQAHHVLPQAIESQFSKIGINVNDPKWGVWVEGGVHQSWTQSYQVAWERWLTTNPNATINQVENEAQALAKTYGFNWK